MILLDGNTHVSSEASLTAISFIFADTAFDANTGIFAALAGSLTVTAFLALAATLAAWLGRQILFVSTRLMLEIKGICGCFARLG